MTSTRRHIWMREMVTSRHIWMSVHLHTHKHAYTHAHLARTYTKLACTHIHVHAYMYNHYDKLIHAYPRKFKMSCVSPTRSGSPPCMMSCISLVKKLRRRLDTRCSGQFKYSVHDAFNTHLKIHLQSRKHKYMQETTLKAMSNGYSNTVPTAQFLRPCVKRLMEAGSALFRKLISYRPEN